MEDMRNVANEPKEVPVYLFTGFLDGGKSSFIQSLFEEEEFNAGEKTLLLLCEEGEVEYEPDKFIKPGVDIVTIEEQYELSEKHLSQLMAEGDYERVVIE
ncbi:MAG: GTPase, partial [Firmicutes bacterium]|nr:GTPase [Bacillota bacterium]